MPAANVLALGASAALHILQRPELFSIALVSARLHVVHRICAAPQRWHSPPACSLPARSTTPHFRHFRRGGARRHTSHKPDFFSGDSNSILPHMRQSRKGIAMQGS